jgi:N utilization substance protein B
VEQKTSKRKGSRFERARLARLAAVQAIFQLSFAQAKPEKVIADFLSQRLTHESYPFPPDQELFLKIMQEGQERKDEVLHHVNQCLKQGWSSERLDPVLAAILTAAITELSSTSSTVSAPVIISEYVDITKGFFQGQEPGYINKALDQVARTLNLPLSK